MSALYRYYLDGVLLQDEPLGWDELVTSISSDESRKGIIVTNDASLTFRGDGFDALYAKFSNNFCSESSIQIQELRSDGIYYVIHEGIIFTPSIVVDEQKQLLTGKVEDNSFFARINNNKNIGAFPWVGKSKNGFDITAAPYYIIEFFDTTSVAPSYITNLGARGGHGFRAVDVFRFLVSFMSDGNLGFTSDYFESGIGKGLAVTCGGVLRDVGNNAATSIENFDSDFPKITFDKLYKELDKKFNLFFIIENAISGNPILRIEDRDYFNGSENTLYSFNDIGQLTREIAQNKLYALIELGDKNNVIEPSISFPGQIPVVGWLEEQYSTLGTCNIDSQLNLVSDYFVSSTVIEKTLLNSTNNENDRELFLINTFLANGKAVPSDILGQPNIWQYNRMFNNISIAKRYYNSLPSPVVSYNPQTGGGYRFLAAQTSYPFITQGTGSHVVLFEDDFTPPNYDNANAYNPTNGRYTSQVATTYIFRLECNFGVRGFGFSASKLQMVLRIYDSGNVLQAEQLGAFRSCSGGVCSFSENLTFNAVYLPVGYYANVQLVYENANNEPFVSNGFFECLSVGAIGQTEIYADISEFPIYLNKFEGYPISKSDFELIKNNPTGLYNFNRGSQFNSYGYIDQIKYNHKLGSADVSLITNTKILKNGIS